MYSSVESVSETMIMLIKSTGRYVHTRIYNKSYAEIYINTLKRCITAIESNLHNYETFKIAIEAIRDDIDTSLKPRLFNGLKQEREYYYLACDQVLDIITKLNARFNTGTSDSEPRNYRNKGILIPNNNIFD